MHSDSLAAPRMNDSDLRELSAVSSGERDTKKRKTMLQLLLVSTVTCFLALIVLGYTTGIGAKLIQVLLFLSAGSLQVWMLRKQTFDQSLKYRNLSMLLMAALVAFLLGGLLLFFLQFDPELVLLAISAFLLPAVVDMLWPMFCSINDVPFQVWSYTEEIPHWKSTVFLNSIPVRFQVMFSGQPAKRDVSFRAPVRMKLGLIFFHMVQEENQGKRQIIPLTHEDSHPLTWVFYLKGIFGWRRYLDPEASLSENKIKPNTLIIALQLPAQEVTSAVNRSSIQSNQSL